MKLNEMLQENDLLKYMGNYQKSINRIKIDTYESIENGFIFTTDKNKYKVYLVIDEDNSCCYTADKVVDYGNGFKSFKHLSCRTRAEEKAYPMSVAWIGTALIEKYRETINN